MLDQLIVLDPMIHAGATWFVLGLNWFVRVVHCPLMGAEGSTGLPAPCCFGASDEHQRLRP